MNGQEKENEIFGSGDAMSAEFWMYDARLGRRWNVDPIYKPWESPYAAFANSPVLFADPYGLNADETGNKNADGSTSSGSSSNSGGDDDQEFQSKPGDAGSGGSSTEEGCNTQGPNNGNLSSECADVQTVSQNNTDPPTGWSIMVVLKSNGENIYNFTVATLSEHPEWSVLTYGGPGYNVGKRKRVMKINECPEKKVNYSCDEFPYACTEEGDPDIYGPAGVSATQLVPNSEQQTQSWWTSLTTAGLKKGDKIIVIPIDDTNGNPVPETVPIAVPMRSPQKVPKFSIENPYIPVVAPPNLIPNTPLSKPQIQVQPWDSKRLWDYVPKMNMLWFIPIINWDTSDPMSPFYDPYSHDNTILV